MLSVVEIQDMSKMLICQWHEQLGIFLMTKNSFSVECDNVNKIRSTNLIFSYFASMVAKKIGEELSTRAMLGC